MALLASDVHLFNLKALKRHTLTHTLKQRHVISLYECKSACFPDKCVFAYAGFSSLSCIHPYSHIHSSSSNVHIGAHTHAPFLWESGVNQWVDFQWVVVTGQTGQIDDGKEEKMKTENGFSKSKHVHHLLLSALHLCVCMVCIRSLCVCMLCEWQKCWPDKRWV